MCLFSLAKIERDLERELQSPPCQSQFSKYIVRLPPDLAAGLAGWPDVRMYLAAVGARAEAVDAALGPLIQMLQASDDESWTSIALYVFWDSIPPICEYYKKLDEPAALFSQVSWGLLQSLRRIDLSRRTNLIGMKILNDVTHDVRAWYRRERKRFPGLVVEEDKPDPSEAIPSQYVDLAIAERAVERQWLEARLDSLVEAGRISRADFQILLGCYFYGRPLEVMARRLGVEYEAAKKARQRAVKKLEKSSPDLSPSSPDSPLYPVGRSARKEADDAR